MGVFPTIGGISVTLVDIEEATIGIGSADEIASGSGAGVGSTGAAGLEVETDASSSPSPPPLADFPNPILRRWAELTPVILQNSRP